VRLFLQLSAGKGGSEVLYFAYGSNMDWQQMQRRCPSSKFVCIARLPDYQFAIARHSRLRHCGTATIVAQYGSDVWGIVYEVSDEDLIALDAFEDGYRRETISVSPLNDGNVPLHALVYIADKEEIVPLPNPGYKRHIMDGARHWQLPASYCAMLEKIQVSSP
jgi:gamma-glutamylcyclotransferase (GGCT)/AIG2-like uncharacterized protein YtfP